MKLTNAKVRLTSNDILEAVQEYVKIEGLKIKEIKIDELIMVIGSYKKKIEIPFEAVVGLGEVHDNIVNAKIFNVKVSKIGILGSIKNLAIKTILKDFSESGITINGNYLAIDLNLISKFIPYAYFSLKSVTLCKDYIEVEADDLVYDPNKGISCFEKKKEESRDFGKMSDNYAKVRGNIKRNVPEKYKDIIEYALLIPDILALLWRLFRDKRVALKTKLLVGGVIAYLASPIDILPDFIPLIGNIDDVAIAFFGMNTIINEVPEEVILSNWMGKEGIIKKIKEGVAFISKMVGAQNVGTLLEYIKRLSQKSKKDEKEA